MPTPTKGARMGGSPAHQKHMLANLAASLFEHGKITTTEARARRLRPYAEKLITFAKRGDMHARRQVLTVVPNKGVVHNLFTEIGPSFADRPGGYTRITKLGPRKGDAAPMAVIELVRDEVTAARPRRRTRRPVAGRPRVGRRRRRGDHRRDRGDRGFGRGPRGRRRDRGRVPTPRRPRRMPRKTTPTLRPTTLRPTPSREPKRLPCNMPIAQPTTIECVGCAIGISGPGWR